MRRGQITLFILIGLVVLLFLLLFLHLHMRVENTIEPVRIAPVEHLVRQCTADSLEHLLRRLGANGGLLNTSRLRHRPNAWESDTVSFPPQDVPYWSHVRPCSQNALGCEASAQPPLCKQGSSCPLTINTPYLSGPSVQEQLEEALPDAVRRCVANFSSIREDLEITTRGEPSADVFIGTERVTATLHWKIFITDSLTGKHATLKDFTEDADVNLPRLYSLANDIANTERNVSFLEHFALHLIAVYSGVDQPIPPLRAVELFGQKHYWVRSEVERLFRDEILPWMNFIQVPNALAGFVPIWPSEEGSSKDEQFYAAGIYQYLNMKPNDEVYPDYAVRFLYPYVKPYLSINKGQEILGPRSAETGSFFQKIIGVFMNDYRFRYDLAFPVLVTITDEDAFDGKGYDWTFALEASIRRNAPLNRSSTASNFRVRNTNIDPLSPFQRVANTIHFSTTNHFTGDALSGVRLMYECGKVYYVGETNASGELTTRLPYCRFGGVVRYSKEGYLGSGAAYDNYEEGLTKDFRFSLWPLQTLTFSVKKLVGSQLRELGPHDQVLVTFTRLNETPYDEEAPLGGFYTFSIANITRAAENKQADLVRMRDKGLISEAQYQQWLDALNESFEFQKQPSVTAKLPPGNYTVDAYLLYFEPFTIPETKKSYGSWPFKKTITLPEQNFSVWMSGGAVINESRPFEVLPDTLYAANNLTFVVKEEPVPKSWEDLEQYKGVAGFSSGPAVNPRWS